MFHSITRQHLLLPIPGPLLVPAIFVVSIAGALLPPGRLRTLSITPALAYLLLNIIVKPTGDPDVDRLLPIQGLVLFGKWVSFYVLRFPEDEFVRDEDLVGTNEDRKVGRKVIGMSWLKKLGWVVDLNLALRGVGWNWKVKNVPIDRPQTKWTFIRKQLTKAFIFYTVMDAIRYFVNSSCYGYPNSAPPFLDDTLARQALFAWLVGITGYLSINMQYPILAALAVFLCIYEPKNWPPLMGKLRDVTTVRAFWGGFWHQCLRKVLAVPFDMLSRVVTIRKGGMVSRYTQLYLAFAASAVLHQSSSFRDREYISGNLVFFLVQPLAITVEDAMIFLGKRFGIEESWRTRMVGRLWTFTWFTFSLRCGLTYGAAHLFKDQIFPSLVEFLASSSKQVFLYSSKEL